MMQVLGHRNIVTTMKYVQPEQALFTRENEAFICKVARTVEDVASLIELSFDLHLPDRRRSAVPEAEVLSRIQKWCPGCDLNTRQSGLQPDALPV